MTEELSDYTKFAEGPLRFPINGKVYVLPPIGIPEGLALAGVIKATKEKDDFELDIDLFKLVLGPLWDEMVADNVPLDAAIHAGVTALADRQYGREFAKITWETGADPKAVEPYVKAMATQTGNRASRRSNSTAGAKKTPKPASTKATKSRKA